MEGVRCARSDSATCWRQGRRRESPCAPCGRGRRKTPPAPRNAAPTSTTSCSLHSRASIGEAQYQTPRPSKSERCSISGAGSARRSPHHRFGAQHIAVVEFQTEAPSSREQSSDITETGIITSAPNFCAWCRRAPSAPSRISRRKAQVIFDPRAGAGLASERARVAHRRQPLGRRIDGGRQSGRAACPQWRHRRPSLASAGASPSRAQLRIPSGCAHRAVGGHHQRQIPAASRIARHHIGGPCRKPIQQMMRIAVAVKSLQPYHVTRTR